MVNWSVERRIIYFLIVLGFFTAIGIWYYIATKPEPTCYDGILNQDELGPDCGGSCPIACVEQIAPVKPVWIRVFRVRDGQYDVAAQIENANRRYGLPELRYRIKVVDQENTLIRMREGVTVLNPGERQIIFEPDIDTGTRVATRAFIEFDQKIPWQKLEVIRPEIVITEKPLELIPQPQLEALVENRSINVLRDLKFTAVLYDADHNAIAVSGTLIESLAGGQSQLITFTWPEPLALAPAVVEIYPVVNNFKLK